MQSPKELPRIPPDPAVNAISNLSDAPNVEPEFQDEPFEESLLSSLDLTNWTNGDNLPELYAHLEAEVRDAVQDEDRMREVVRRDVFARIPSGKRAAPDAGLHAFTVDHLAKAHRGLLFNGAVEACDGTVVVHDTLPLTITQIGVCTVRYNGATGSYAHRHYRRDLRSRSGDPIEEVMALLENRKKRDAVGVDGNYVSSGDAMSQLARRGVMAYAERAILLEKCEAPWRMGHGHPTTYELMTGHWAHRPDMVDAGLSVMRRLVLEHKKWVFVPSAPRKRELLTIGNALRPLEYLLMMTAEDDLNHLVEIGHARGDARKKMDDFAHEVGSKIVVGMFRVSEAAPASIFYAHAEHAHTAALIAMADSALQLHRGFPMLIDLADRLCAATFDTGSFTQSVQAAYAGSGAPFRFLGERETRQK